MKIGIDIRTLMEDKYSGIPEYSLCLVRELLKIDKQNQYILFYNSFKDLSSKIPEFKNKNVSIVKTRYPSKFFGYILQKLLKWPKLDRLLKVDVFFMPHINFCAFSSKVKTMITVHDLSFLIYPRFFSLKKNIWHKAVNVKKMLKKFDCVVAISKNTKQDLVEYCQLDEKKIKVVYSGISKNFKKINQSDQRLKEVKQKYNLPNKFILSLCTIEPRKNIDGLIRAYEKFVEQNKDSSDLKLVIAGARGWKYNKVIETWKNSKYKDDIIFVSYVDKGDKVYLYNLAKIFIFPSFYEGFGFPPLEAMACGVPVITSANSSLTEILSSAAIFIDPYDINSIKQAISELVSSPQLRESLAQKGYSNVQTYTWEKTAKQMLAIIDTELKPKSR